MQKAEIRITIAHFQSPLKSGGKKPNNNTVHENPTGACLTTSYSGCLRFKVENAISIKNDLFIIKIMP